LGWFGGGGFAPTLQFLTGLGLPAALALLVILIEFFGAISLVSGFLARLSALGVIAVMLGAILKVHLPHGFFMNWSGTQPGEGFEYHLLVVGMALAILLFGAGSASVDRSMSEKNRNPYR
jgi:putative oxidoreductase